MKLTWVKWSALAAAVLTTGSVALAQGKPRPSSQPTPPPQNATPPPAEDATPQREWTPTTAPTPAAKPKPKPIPARRKDNPNRFGQGVKSGQSTAGQTAHLETKQTAINGQTKGGHAANGGKLPIAEKKQVNKEPNPASKNINKKQNPKTQPEAKPQQ